MDNMQGPESEEFAAASRLEDDVNFYQTVDPEVAKLFHIDINVKRPALILVKKEEEKLNRFGLFNFSFLLHVISHFFLICKFDVFFTLSLQMANLISLQ